MMPVNLGRVSPSKAEHNKEIGLDLVDEEIGVPLNFTHIDEIKVLQPSFHVEHSDDD